MPVLAVLCALPVAAQTREKIDVSKLGPRVGQKVPDFSLPDQFGKKQTLQSIMGPKGAMLVFVRSADWCPYCKTQLVELQEQADELAKQGYGIATISYDPVETLAGFAKQHSITYPMLSDAGSATIKRYGLLNTVPVEALGPNKDDPAVAADVKKYVSLINPSARMVGIAFPGNFILDPKGVVTSRYFEDFYVERNTVASILVKLGADTAGAVDGRRVSTQHLRLTTYASNYDVAMGQRFALVFDLIPNKNVHVYAPGAEKYGYGSISLKMEENPDIDFGEMQYPESEIYHFIPLDERVPVYQKEFRLVQEVVLKGGADAFQRLRGKKTVTIKGTLQYQACNDKICFLPASVPLTWTVRVRDLVTQR